eukprot:12882659-Prorocentrum_lima.AAC.1
MVEREQAGSGVDESDVKKYLQTLQQDFGLMRDTMTSEFSMLEGTIPNAKEVAAKWVARGGSLRE